MPDSTLWAPPEGALGLMPDEAERRLAAYGPNTLVPVAKRSGPGRWLLHALADPMVILLLVAGATYVALGDIADAVVVVIAVVPVTLVSLVLEARSERALEALRALAAPVARVWRGNEAATIPAELLVPGDLVHLQEGDLVAADGTLLDGPQLAVDESALTGESLAVNKAPTADRSAFTATATAGPPPDESARLYGGTTVVSGRGVFRVTATGAATRYGQIGKLVGTIETTKTPMERVIGRLMAQLGTAALLACVVVALIELAGGHGWQAAVIAGVSLAIAAMPEEFPMVYTLYLTLGAWRLARENLLVRRLAGVEALGSTTVICADKTGTLTQGQVTVTGVFPEASVDERRLLTAAVLACEPQPFDLLEQAIVAHANVAGVDVSALHELRLVHDFPFDVEHKYMSHVWHDGDRTMIAAKGSIEGILARSQVSEATRTAAREANERLAAAGMRVLAVAGGELPGEVSAPAAAEVEHPSGPPASTPDRNGLWTALDRQAAETHLGYLGLVAFADPLRAGVREAIEACRQAGIRVIMITGDHPTTAHAIADDLRLPHDEDNALATGDDLDAADGEALTRLVDQVNIFARTRPEQKYRIVQALKDRGHVVAMTGDGINDAPALRAADIGVAMGRRGTTVARESATLILLDDNFATIVRAVEEGRRIFENLRRAFGYLIAFHTPLLAGALVVPLLGLPLLLLPVHLVWLEIIVHPTSSLVFEADRAELAVMRRPPRPPGEGLITLAGFLRAAALGVTLSMAVVGIYALRLQAGVPENAARAAALAVLFVGQVYLVLAERSPNRPLWQRAAVDKRSPGNPWTIWLILAATIASLLVALYLPPLASMLRVSPISLADWGQVLVVAALATLWQEPWKKAPATPS